LGTACLYDHGGRRTAVRVCQHIEQAGQAELHPADQTARKTRVLVRPSGGNPLRECRQLVLVPRGSADSALGENCLRGFFFKGTSKANCLFIRKMHIIENDAQ